MREIKFRYVLKNKMSGVIDYLYFTLTEVEGLDYRPVNRRDWEIISRDQFTGLHDINSKEIYEGDIILNPLYEEPYAVEYVENLAGYVGWGDDRVCGCYLITDDDIEVIGNIHENPELIK